MSVEHDVARGDVGAVVQPEVDQPAAMRTLGEIRGEGVVGIDHRDAVDRQVVVHRRLGVGDGQQAPHALDVRGRHVVDHADVRPRDGGEVGDVARLAGAQLVDGELRVLGRFQHRQRHADLVVAVARRGVGAPGALQDRQGQRLDAGLAVAAGDRHDLAGASLDTAALHCGREVGQRALGIGDDHLRHRCVDFTRHQRRRDTGLRRLGDVVVTVETLALQCDEQRGAALRQRAGIGGDGIDRPVLAMQAAGRHARNVGQAQRLHARPPRAARATCVSSKGCCTPSMSW